MPSRQQVAGIVVASALALVASACGTRLPDSAFTATERGSGAVQAVGNGGSASDLGTGQGGATTGQASGGSAAGGGSAPTGGGAAPGSGGSSGGTSSGGGGGGASAKNTASDIGVTPTTIRVGNISSRSNPFDPRAFVGPYLGAKAFFQNLNAHGGVNGRKIDFYACDDRANSARNQACVRNLIDTTKVFAFVGNAIFDYAAADYTQQKGVPDIGGQPIDNAYNTYSHLYSIYGVDYPRNGKVGFNGTLYGGTENYRFLKEHFPHTPRKAGVVYYNQAAAKAFGQYIAKGLRTEGFQAVEEEVDFALPDFNAAVIQMKNAGVQFVFDVMDVGGNQSLCRAMEQNQLYVTAKVTTTQGWTAGVKEGYANSPHCRQSMYAIGMTRNYDDLSKPGVKEFRDAVKRYGYDGKDQLSDWELEGWAAGKWFTDAVSSCGAKVTRTCVEAFMNRPQKYDAGGLLIPRNFEARQTPRKQVTNCINVVRWRDALNGGAGGWQDIVPDMDNNCFTVPNIPYDQ